MQKKGEGQIQTGITIAILALVIITVLFSLLGDLMPEAMDAGDNMNETTLCALENSAVGSCNWNGSTDTCDYNSTNHTHVCEGNYEAIPLSGLFSGTGVVILIVMASFFIMIIASFMGRK